MSVPTKPTPYQISEAKLVINRARADLGHDLAGYSVRDLLLDQIPAPSAVIDEILRIIGERV